MRWSGCQGLWCLCAGDIIVQVNDRIINRSPDLANVLDEFKLGEQVLSSLSWVNDQFYVSNEQWYLSSSQFQCWVRESDFG